MQGPPPRDTVVVSDASFRRDTQFLSKVAPVESLDERKLDEYLALIDKKIGGSKDWSCLSEAERITITGYLFALAGD